MQLKSIKQQRRISNLACKKVLKYEKKCLAKTFDFVFILQYMLFRLRGMINGDFMGNSLM